MRAETILLTAKDGHKFEAWRADPSGKAKGGIVLLHAVFGRTPHMGDVCTQWADAGYAAIAPALFDRLATGTVHPYSREGVEAGTQSYAQLRAQDVLADIDACATALRGCGPVVISGFCTGGSWAWRAAAELVFDAQVNFYASHAHLQTGSSLRRAAQPSCILVILIPSSRRRKLRASQPRILT